MAWARRAAFALLLVAAVLAVGVLIGTAYGDAGLGVAAVEATGKTPTNTSANCEDVVVRTVVATTTIERDGFSLANPQLWDTGVTVRASAFQQSETTQVTLSPGQRRTVALSFTRVVDERSTPREWVDATVRVSHGNTLVTERTATATLVPVKAGTDC